MAIDEAKLRAEPRIADAFRPGKDIGWHERGHGGGFLALPPDRRDSVQSCLRGPSQIIDWRSDVQ